MPVTDLGEGLLTTDGQRPGRGSRLPLPVRDLGEGLLTTDGQRPGRGKHLQHPNSNAGIFRFTSPLSSNSSTWNVPTCQ